MAIVVLALIIAAAIAIEKVRGFWRYSLRRLARARMERILPLCVCPGGFFMARILSL
jgi:hypothetical protein